MRNDSVDVFRLIAALAVVTLHVTVGLLAFDTLVQVRFFARFAVPFFFMISGYFFYVGYENKKPDNLKRTVQKLLTAFIIASLIYLPKSMLQHTLNVDLNLLLEGTSQHLWYIPVLVIALIICRKFLFVFNHIGLTLVLCAIFLLPVLFAGSYVHVLPFTINYVFARFLAGIAFVWIGMLTASKKPSVSTVTALVLVFAGLALQILEFRYLKQEAPFDVFDFEFIIGTIPLAIGIFFLSFTGFNNSRLAAYGRKHSFIIYLYHPLVNTFVYNGILLVVGSYSDDVLLFNPLICFAVTLSISVALNKFLPGLFQLLNGTIKYPENTYEQRNREHDLEKYG